MKRVTTFLLAFLMAVSCGLSIPAAAVSMRSNKTIASSSATLHAGNQSGQLKINYTVSTNSKSSSFGVETIYVYTMNGELVKTTAGTVPNGLMKKDGVVHAGTYYIDGLTPGQYYYAEVTVFAVIDNVYDSYTHLTSTIRAPK